MKASVEIVGTDERSMAGAEGVGSDGRFATIERATGPGVGPGTIGLGPGTIPATAATVAGLVADGL